MMSAVRYLIVAALVMLGHASVAVAQTTTPSATAVSKLVDCRKIAEADARLRCYDGAVDTLSSAVAAGSIVVVDQEDLRQTRRSLFGFALPKLPFFKGDKSAEEQTNEINATIKSVRALPNDKYLIEIDSGAHWQTVQEAGFQATPKSGEKIRIRGGALGSYRISVENRPGLRAMRVR